jgi:hypothetical protein
VKRRSKKKYRLGDFTYVPMRELKGMNVCLVENLTYYVSEACYELLQDPESRDAVLTQLKYVDFTDYGFQNLDEKLERIREYFKHEERNDERNK